MHRRLKGKLVIGGAVLAVAAFAGGAYAATQNSGPTTRQEFLNDVAQRLHVTPEQLSSALKGAYLDELQAAVKAGRLTQAQANALQQRLERSGAAPALPFGFVGPGPGAFPGPRRFGRGIGFIAGPGSLGAAAQYLGLTDVQLFQQLASGKSLAQIATAKGKSVNGLEQAMSSAAKSRLDKLVAGKVITAAQEQRILAGLNGRVLAAVNQKGLPFRRGFAPRLRFRFGGPAGAYGAPGPPQIPVPAPGTLAVPAPGTLPVPAPAGAPSA